MSDLVPHKRTLHREGRLRWFHSEPKTIAFVPGKGAEVSFVDGSKGRGTCLGCHDSPCMELTGAQLNIGGTLSTFPGDPSRDVCPTGAIEWDEAGAVPTINTQDCIGCGLCALRCPYGAIQLTVDGMALVEGSDPDGITTTETGAAQCHVMTPRVGALGNVAMPFARMLLETIARLTDIQVARLARNMLAACGMAASMRRKGDTNIRMDGLVRLATDQIGVVELETGTAVLENPRALLEDMAVLYGRFRVPKANIVLISVLGELPNYRAEYYQVIEDIAKVLNVHCRTLTLGAICMVMWRFVSLKGLDGDSFALRRDKADLFPSLARLISDLSVEEPYPGAYRPSK